MNSDQIPRRPLQEYAYEIAPSLTKVINFSLSTGCVLEECKCADVAPVRKKYYAEDVTKYRLIFRLNLVEKVTLRI